MTLIIYEKHSGNGRFSYNCTQSYLSWSCLSWVNRIEDSKTAFFKAFAFNKQIQLDTNYITHEISLLFSNSKNAFFNQQNEFRVRDSVLLKQKKAFENSTIELQKEAKNRHSHSTMVFSLSFFSISAILGALMAYEYNSTKDSYTEYKTAARLGDKMNYDKNKVIVNRANIVICACGVAATTSIACGVVFTRNAHKSNTKK